MTLASVRNSIIDLESHLPFELDNLVAINSLYTNWYQNHDPVNRRIIDIWTYCYVQRFMVKKFIMRRNKDSADLDLLITKAFQNTKEYQSNIKKPDIYGHWVSVICKNTFVNYVQRNVVVAVSIEEEEDLDFIEEVEQEKDPDLVMNVVKRAIGNLQPHLQEIANRKLLDCLSYSELSVETKYSEATLRAYINKIRKLLIEDPVFAELEYKF